MFVITSPNVFIKDRFTPAAVFVRDGLIADIFPISEFSPESPAPLFLDFNNAFIVPRSHRCPCTSQRAGFFL